MLSASVRRRRKFNDRTFEARKLPVVENTINQLLRANYVAAEMVGKIVLFAK